MVHRCACLTLLSASSALPSHSLQPRSSLSPGERVSTQLASPVLGSISAGLRGALASPSSHRICMMAVDGVHVCRALFSVHGYIQSTLSLLLEPTHCEMLCIMQMDMGKTMYDFLTSISEDFTSLCFCKHKRQHYSTRTVHIF